MKQVVLFLFRFLLLEWQKIKQKNGRKIVPEVHPPSLFVVSLCFFLSFPNQFCFTKENHRNLDLSHTHTRRLVSEELLHADILRIPPMTSLQISQFMDYPPGSTPGNVGVAISGGSSRSMVAGMGQLRGLKTLCNSKGNLLDQTRAISAVSGGAWLSAPFMYLKDIPDDVFLGVYQDPSAYTVEGLQQLDEGNIGARCTKKFSAKNLSFEAFLLLLAGFPSEMVWQTLVGIHILDFYGLYSQSAGLPNRMFSYDEKTLEPILNSNASLVAETVDLVTTEKNRIHRPYFICNASMFVNTHGNLRQSLVPVQITPFFAGILSSPSGAVDANGQAVGGGAVTPFACNSKLRSIEDQSATFLQSRQFSLTDAIGISSSFFAEYLEKMARSWGGDLVHFFADVRDQLHPSCFQHLINKVPNEQGRIIYQFLSKLEKLILQNREISVQKLSKAEVNPEAVRSALEKLASIVPKYHYWSVDNLLPQKDTLDNAFADGGNLENTGICALLLYEDIDSIISFVNSSTPLSQAEHGIIDASGEEIPDTRIEVNEQIPPLFGYQPYDDKVGYRLYSMDTHPNSPLTSRNQIFPSEAFAELLQGLWQASGNKENPGSNQYAANYLQTLTTIANPWFGIRDGKQIKVLWVYNNFINSWYEQLSAEVRQEVFNNDPTQYHDFPCYTTLSTELTATQVNLLAGQTSWSVVEGSSDEILSLYQ